MKGDRRRSGEVFGGVREAQDRGGRNSKRVRGLEEEAGEGGEVCGNTRGMGSGQDAGERERGAGDHTARGKGLTGAEEGTTEGGRRRGDRSPGKM